MAEPTPPPRVIYRRERTAGGPDDGPARGDGTDMVAEVRRVEGGPTQGTVTADAASGAGAGDSMVTVRAVPVDDGPLAFLGTKSGRAASAAACVLIAGLVAGLVAGLPRAGSVPGDGGGGGDVLAVAGGTFCNAGVPGGVFHGRFQSLCGIDEVALGGTMQQAVVDAHLAAAGNGADFAVMNAGAVRGEIPGGRGVTAGDVRTALPFRDDTVVVLEVTGEGLGRMIGNAVAWTAREVPLDELYSGAYPYAAGVRYGADPLGGGDGEGGAAFVTDVQIRVDGEWTPLSGELLDGTYRVVTSSYVAGGGDGYLEGVDVLSSVDTGRGFTDEVVEYLRSTGGEWTPPGPDEMSTVSFVVP